jgi:endoglucanase
MKKTTTVGWAYLLTALSACDSGVSPPTLGGSGGTQGASPANEGRAGAVSADPTQKTQDMVINEPAPPADETLDSLVIDHPLQALALESLDKGYNITNWLEQETFNGFVSYDEAFVESLAAAGFESLRLPVDLDRYIVDRSAYFAGDVEFGVDPTLFTILDSFDEWTETHGLSLTIDYHQYDASLDLANPLYVDAVVRLWESVAEHFADNPRPDLFFELLNEPEQSAGVNSFAQSEWTTFAARLIEAIRTFDATRVILFGDVQWYGISTLVSRTPFEDENIIYVFHFYEPFIFTHQGSSWTELASAHDIPYPYSADRWTESFSDLGIDPSVQPTWIIDQVRSYYTTGNRSSLRNTILAAKRWAVDNNVPVICNEFGVFPAGATKGDRVAYYTDLVAIFEELEIPWQHWFMFMDPATGTIDPDLAAAFGLD